MAHSANQTIRDEIIATLNAQEPSEDPSIGIDYRGDVFHSALGDHGTVILSSEQLDALAALVEAGRRPNPSEPSPTQIDQLRQLCANPFDVLEIETDDGTITATPVIRASDLIAVLESDSR